MHEIKVYKSRCKAIRLILLCLPFVLGTLYFINDDSNKLTSWGCICFFGLGILVGLINLFDNRPELILTDEGIFNRSSYSIFDKNPDRGFVKWSSVKDIYPKIYQNSYRGLPLSKQKFICFRLDDKSNKKKKSKFAEALGLGDYSIPLLNLRDIDEEKFIALLRAMISTSDEARRNLLLTSKI